MCIPLVFVFHSRPLFLPILHTSAENMPGNYQLSYTVHSYTHAMYIHCIVCVHDCVVCHASLQSTYRLPEAPPQAMYCKHLPHTSHCCTLCSHTANLRLGPAERNWSVHSAIKTASRSRLGHATANKLVYCHEAIQLYGHWPAWQAAVSFVCAGGRQVGL